MQFLHIFFFVIYTNFMKKQSLPWLIAVISLSLVLIAVFALGVSGYFFSLPHLHFDTDLNLGESVTISVFPNETSVSSWSFDGAYLPNEKIPQKIQINAEKLTSDVFIRIKSKIFCKEGDAQFEFLTTEKFSLEEDDYYYYDGTILGGDKVTFCEYAKVPQNVKLDSDKKYIVSIIVECLDSTQDISSLWGNFS